jgi:hypothetical protein
MKHGAKLRTFAELAGNAGWFLLWRIVRRRLVIHPV